MRKRGGDAVGLRRAVTSPGGVTAAGLAALEGYGVRAAFGAAVEAVVEKAKRAQPPAGNEST
jgi:pyrroline-5-carboxylate reductase